VLLVKVVKKTGA